MRKCRNYILIFILLFLVDRTIVFQLNFMGVALFYNCISWHRLFKLNILLFIFTDHTAIFFASSPFHWPYNSSYIFACVGSTKFNGALFENASLGVL
jgi:hypothetical protein